MKKRWICGILAIVLLMGMLPGVSMKTQAVTNKKVSQALLDVTKEMEGFAQYPYWDYSQWTVGYGTECPDDKLEEYKTNGITEEEAEALLHEEMAIFESEVNNFLRKNGLDLSQHQFDALVSLSYNCGGNWTYDQQSVLAMAVRSGDTGNGIIYAMSLYSKARSDYVLIKRRMAEANMYINGIYKSYNRDEDAVPTNYKHVFLDGNGGTVYYTIHGYDSNDPMEIMTGFSHIPGGVDADGNAFLYEFSGWYTASTGGTKIEKLDGSLSNGAVLYAQWKDPQGNTVVLPKGDVVDDLQITVNSNINVRSGPGSYYPKIGSISKDSIVTITETFKGNNAIWGKFENGWISLAYTNYEEVINSLPTEGVWPREGTVTGTGVNVRSGPGTSNDVQYQLNVGDRVTISELYNDGKLEWGKLADGNWICMSYVKLDPLEGENAPPVITGISLVKGPDKTQYVQMQDELNMIGSIVQINYSDGTVSGATLRRSMVSAYSNKKLGQITAKATYNGYTVSFTVEIVKATVTFVNYDGTVLSQAQYAYGEKVVEPEIPVKPADEQGEYIFVGWDPEVTACNGDATYTAVFRKKPELFTVTFLNYDGTILSQAQYEMGAEVVVPAAPTRPADENGEYVFIGWDKPVTVCDGEKTYTAVFEQKKPTYTVTFLNYDGTILSQAQYEIGAEVVVPAAPTRPADENGEYVFIGWDKPVTVCDGEKTYTAVFELQKITYTVTFLNYDGTVLSQAQYEIGAEVVIPAAPTRPADENGAYVFIGWDKKVTACQGDMVYTAVFKLLIYDQTDAGLKYGFVITDGVNVRTGPGTNYDKADYKLNTGDRVVISQIVYDGSTYHWGKMADGNWVCMNYVRLYQLGDFDGNEKVDEKDAIYLLRHVVFADKYPVNQSADINGDGTVNEKDAIYLLRHVVFPDKYPLLDNN